MTCQLLVLQVIPDLLIRIPIRGVLREMEDMQTRLTGNPGLGLPGRVRRGLVHDDHQVAARVMFEHLREELDHFLRGDPFFQQAKQKMPATTDG